MSVTPESQGEEGKLHYDYRLTDGSEAQHLSR